MKPASVQAYPPPSYPTRLEALSDPLFLERYLPPAFAANLRLRGMVALFVAVSTAGCHQNAAASPASPPEGTGIIQIPVDPSPVSSGGRAPSGPASALVAPLFEHGDGRGATGCVMIAPPVFLSEEDAMSVVREELAAAGIRFSGKRMPIPGAQVTHPARGGGDRQTSSQLVMDAVDSSNRIAVEFITVNDSASYDGGADFGSVTSYDTKSAAKAVNSALQQSTSPMYFGVLYDPCEFVEPDRSQHQDWDALEAITKRKSLEQLRRQVKDFVAWLQKHGAV